MKKTVYICSTNNLGSYLIVPIQDPLLDDFQCTNTASFARGTEVWLANNPDDVLTDDAGAFRLKYHKVNKEMPDIYNLDTRTTVLLEPTI
jgi:hypothetical protein